MILVVTPSIISSNSIEITLGESESFVLFNAVQVTLPSIRGSEISYDKLR